MTDYTKTTNFTAKDSLPPGDSNKVIRGSEFDTEFGAIQTSIATKADSSVVALKAPLASPTFTGTVVLPSSTSIGTVSSTELSYVDGVTSSIQTQIDTKAPSASPTFTGTVVLPSGTSIGNVSSTELSYLDGVTDNIQTQFSGKQDIDTDLTTLAAPGSLSDLDAATLASDDALVVYDTSASSYKRVKIQSQGPRVEAAATQTLALDDGGKLMYNSGATAYTVTVPPNSSVAFPIGTELAFGCGSTGKILLAQGAGVTITSLSSYKRVKASGGAAYIVKTGTDAWFLAGDLEA